MNPLIASAIFYPTLLCLIAPRQPPISWISVNRRIVSTVHSTVLTALTLAALRKERAKWTRHNSSQGVGEDEPGDPGAAPHPMVSARSPLANSLIGVEAGYL